jgi:cyclopropane-fatty-acyl-phospholipid synthase
LKLWRDKFLAEKQQVLKLGFDERFIRIWEFYLAYCEAAFAKKNTDVVQFTLQKV